MKTANLRRHYGRRNRRRNAGTVPASSSQPQTDGTPGAEQETPSGRIGWTAAAAAGTVVLGAFLAREGWAPKPVAAALTAVGAGLALKGAGASTKSVGLGAMAAAGGVLTLLTMRPEDKDKSKEENVAAGQGRPPTPADVQTRRASDGLPPGALESAFQRARAHLVMTSGELEDLAA